MVEILTGDSLTVLHTLPSESVHCVVTSPPYWGLRDYGVEGQMGLEKTPGEYIAKMVEVFREVRRVLRSDGTCWVNIGDSYAGSWGNYHPNSPPGKHGQRVKDTARWNRPAYQSQEFLPPTANIKSCKPKDLVGIPWMLAFALRTDGWWLRSDIIWSKPNPMPESVTDRPTKAHEYLFLLAKSERYFYDAEAIKEAATCERMRGSGPMVQPGTGRNDQDRKGDYRKQDGIGKRTYTGFNQRWDESEANGSLGAGRNKRTVWEIATSPFPEAHFATFPPALVEPCIKAGTSERGCCPECGAPWGRVTEKTTRFESGYGKAGNPPNGKNGSDYEQAVSGDYDIRMGPVTETRTTGWRPTCKHGFVGTLTATEYETVAEKRGLVTPCTVLDPFAGAGTTGLVANHLNRNFIGIELSPEYVIMSINRIENTVITRNGDGRLKCKYAPR